jgi:HAE1 family hydrophobic/amphiphilic exporter-1
VAGLYRSGGRRPRRIENVGQFYVRNNKGENVPLSTLTTLKPRLGPEFIMRYNEYRSAQINGSAAPGYSADQATAALEDVFQTDHAARDGFRLFGYFLSGAKSAPGSAACGDLRAFAAVHLPRSGGIV